MGPVALDPELTLAEILKKSGTAATSRIYENLGLLGKSRAKDKRAEIAVVLLQRSFLNSLVRDLPAESRKLLRTVVRVGGYVPATTLFQNTGRRRRRRIMLIHC